MTTANAKNAWEPPTPEELSLLLPQYEITLLLGRGGMGAVYQAVQKNLDRPIAIKILPPDIGEGEGGFAQRFKNEAKAMARLNHPGIIEVYNSGETVGGLLYIVMEFVAGTDVQHMVAKQGRLSGEHALAITAHVCDALAYAHERGIVHRDIKPANVMVGYDGVVKVADFGLAKMSHAGESGLTQSGMAMGTLHFMAPEALMLGSAVDHRADLYAVGVMLYQMLTGKLPKGLFEMPSKLVNGLDPRFDDILRKALREDRDIRHQSAAEFRAELDRILTQPVPKVEAGAEEAPAALPTQARPKRAAVPARELPPPPLLAPPPRKRSSTVMWTALLAVAGLVIWLALIPQATPTIDTTAKEDAPDSAPSAAATPVTTPPSETPKVIPPSPSVQQPVSKPATLAPVKIVGDPPDKQRRVTELLPLADPVRDKLSGQWKRTSAGMLCEVAGRLQLPHPVTCDEFDYEFEFSLMSEAVSWVCARFHAAGRTIPFTMQEHRLRERPFYHFVFLDGASASTVTPAVAELPEKLARGKRYHCTLKIRKNSLNAIWNDVPVVYWEGDLRRFSHDRNNAKKDPRFPDIGVSSGSVLFHNARVIEFLPPAPLPELVALQQQWEKLSQERVTDAHAAELAKLNTGYLGGLERAITDESKAGRAASAEALRQEKLRVEAKQPVPGTADPVLTEPLRKLRGIYLGERTKLEQQRAQNLQALLTPYLTRLWALETELGSAGRAHDVAMVKTHRESMAALLPKQEASPAPEAAPVAAVAVSLPVFGSPLTPPSNDVPVPDWLETAKKRGGRLRLEGVCKGVRMVPPPGHNHDDYVEVAAQRDIGWCARRANGDLIYCWVKPGQEAIGLEPGVRSISLGAPLSFVTSDGALARLTSRGLERLSLPPHPEAVEGLTLVYGCYLLKQTGSKARELIAGERKDLKELPPDFFDGASQVLSTGWVAVGLFQNQPPRTWALHPASSKQDLFAGALLGCIQADSPSDRFVLMRNGAGQVFVSDCEGSSRPVPSELLPPPNLPRAIRVRGGSGLANGRVNSPLCAAQIGDGTWRSWGKDGSLTQMVEKLGVALDLDATSSDKTDGFLIWIEPAPP